MSDVLSIFSLTSQKRTNMQERRILNLSEVCRSLENSIRRDYPESFWLRAEISKLNFYPQSGHAYPELVEKKDGKIVAHIKTAIWQSNFRRINERFLSVLKEPLRDGINIVCRAKLSYSAIHGLNMVIDEIDPTMTLGDLEREKNECIERLKKENLFEQNKRRLLTLLPQRIAVISVETSKGYSDFIETINKQRSRYGFYIHLFPSLLQGDAACVQLVEALKVIESVKQYFDCVLIIRGGGGDVGLTCYNNYNLCHKIATFPLPVLTGIGHSTNQTVSEMVSYADFITPTALANYILDKFDKFSNDLDYCKQRIIKGSQNLLQREKTNTDHYNKFLLSSLRNRIEREKSKIENSEKMVKVLNPLNILQRGYSITTLDGALVKDPAQLHSGQTIKTRVAKGEFESKIV